MKLHYTAHIISNQESVLKIFGNSLSKLIICLLTKLETENTATIGNIVDNTTGETLYACRKAAF